MKYLLIVMAILLAGCVKANFPFEEGDIVVYKLDTTNRCIILIANSTKSHARCNVNDTWQLRTIYNVELKLEQAPQQEVIPSTTEYNEQ